METNNPTENGSKDFNAVDLSNVNVDQVVSTSVQPETGEAHPPKQKGINIAGKTILPKIATPIEEDPQIETAQAAVSAQMNPTNRISIPENETSKIQPEIVTESKPSTTTPVVEFDTGPIPKQLGETPAEAVGADAPNMIDENELINFNANAEEEGEVGFDELENDPYKPIETTGKGASIFRVAENKDYKTLRNLNPTLEQIEKSTRPVDQNNQIFADYMRNTASSLIARRVVKIPNPIAGEIVQFTSYGTLDLIEVLRITQSENVVANRREVLSTLHAHILKHSASKDESGRLTFEEWIAITPLPDLPFYFYAAYVATFPGDMPVTLECFNCHNVFDHKDKIENVMFFSDKDLNSADFEVYHRETDPRRYKELPIYKKAQGFFAYQIIQPSQTYVEYGVPSLKDELDTLAAIEAMGKDPAKRFENGSAEEILYKMMYVKRIRIAIPNTDPVTGNRKITYHETADKRFILPILSRMEPAEIAKIFAEPTIKQLIAFQPVRFVLKDITCTNDKCGKHFDLPLDMEDFYFLRVERDASII